MTELVDGVPHRVARPPAAPPASPAPVEEKLMSLGEHLGELRRRLVISALAVGAGTVVGWLVAPQAVAILSAPVPGPLYFTHPAGAFFALLKIALVIGIALGSPMVLYQLWAFIAPGLTPEERRTTRPWVPLTLAFMALGFAVAYVVLPFAIAFLLSFQVPGVFVPLVTMELYFGFVTTLFLAFGVVMQFPIVLLLLAKVGLVDAQRLRRGRRYVLFGIVVMAVLVTPGGDPVSPTMMALVMYPLYELTIRLVGRSERARAAEAVDADGD